MQNTPKKSSRTNEKILRKIWEHDDKEAKKKAIARSYKMTPEDIKREEAETIRLANKLSKI